MATDNELHHQSTALLNPGRRVGRPGIPLRRRPRLPSVRLGGKRPRRVVALVGMLRRIRMRWLRLQYMCMVRKLRECYRNLAKDLAEAGASIDTFQKRVFLEASFAVPVMGLAFSGYPNSAPPPGSDHRRPRTLAM